MKPNKQNIEKIKQAISLEYSADKLGNVYNKNGDKLSLDNLHRSGYRRFSINTGDARETIFFHRFIVAFFYGIEALTNSECVRHLDGNKLNNNIKNLKTGTILDNIMDRPKEERVRTSTIGQKRAVEAIKRKDWSFIDEDRESGMSYGELQQKHGISKGTLSYRYSLTAAKKRKI